MAPGNSYVARTPRKIHSLPLDDSESTLDGRTLGRLSVRNVDLKDVPELRTLLNRAYAPLLLKGLNYTATFQDDDLTRDSLFDGGFVLVVEKNSALIATVKLRRTHRRSRQKDGAEECLYLSRFAVLPEFQKYGLGSELLELAEKIGRRLGFRYLQLDTAQSADHLIQFYESKSFRIVRPIYHEGKTYTSWVFEKDLKQPI
jgi:ribosomal protein S18 acetylase RimI-like enzyme